METVTRKRAAPRARAAVRAETGALVAKRSSYHHGNLREALVKRGIEIVEAEGVAALSMRRVARDLRVSPTAPLHHFDNSAAYLAAIAAQGFRMLYERRSAPLRSKRDSTKRLLGVMLAHLQFAVDHGALFQLMYGPDIPNKKRFPELERAATRSYSVLEDCVTEYLRERKGSNQRAHPTALAAWTACHGLATIMVDRRNAWDIIRKDPMKIGREVFAILIAGLDHP